MKRNFSFSETCRVNYNVPIRTYLSPDFAFLSPNKHTSSSHVTARAYIEETKDCKGKSIIFVPHHHYAMCNNNVSVFQHQFKISNSKVNNYKKKFNDVFTIKKSLPLKLSDKFVLINKHKQPIINKTARTKMSRAVFILIYKKVFSKVSIQFFIQCVLIL